jgi:hypothetical protein
MTVRRWRTTTPRPAPSPSPLPSVQTPILRHFPRPEVPAVQTASYSPPPPTPTVRTPVATQPGGPLASPPQTSKPTPTAPPPATPAPTVDPAEQPEPSGVAIDAEVIAEPAVFVGDHDGRTLQARSDNGCGPGGLYGLAARAVPDSIPYVFDFGAACAGHDQGYGTWGTWRFQIDSRFHGDMVSTCPSQWIQPPTLPNSPFSTPPTIRRANPRGIACHRVARIYYIAVKEAGQGVFYNNQLGQIGNCGLPTRELCVARARYRSLYPNER